MDMIDLFDRATAWTAINVAGAEGQLHAATPCDEWSVRRLIDHLLAGQATFASGPSGGTVAPPVGPPPQLVGNDPAAQYEHARKATLNAYAPPGVLEGTVKGRTGEVPAAMVLGLAFCDQLIHGWDLATATGQDTTMPADLVAVAWQMLDGQIAATDRGPGKNFKAAVTVPEGAGEQDRLLAYCGRMPAAG
ncbi:MAG: TIGR03086 family metal-binding protein [Acidimicrobiales bacterium]